LADRPEKRSEFKYGNQEGMEKRGPLSPNPFLPFLPSISILFLLLRALRDAAVRIYAKEAASGFAFIGVHSRFSSLLFSSPLFSV
jgi:hypothetical protein